MKVGDLVRKKWGVVTSYQRDTVAIVLNPQAVANGLLLTGRLIKVAYPGRKPELRSASDFEVINASR